MKVFGRFFLVFITLTFNVFAQTLILDVNENALKEDMQDLTVLNKPDLREEIISRLSALGYEYEFQEVAREGKNLIFRKAGNGASPKLVTVGAHYDHFYSGADDNMSGTIAVLTLAKSFANINFENDLEFVFFDHEEDGIIGSGVYATKLKHAATPFLGAFTMDMIGYDSDDDGGMEIQVCNSSNEESKKLSKLMVDTIVKRALPLKTVFQCNTRSDQVSFWNQGLPAVNAQEMFFTGDRNRCYHRSCDVWSIINYKYMANIIKAVGYTSYEVLGVD